MPTINTLNSAMCGGPWSRLLVRRQGLNKIICLALAGLADAQNTQTGNCARLDQTKAPGRSDRRLCARSLGPSAVQIVAPRTWLTIVKFSVVASRQLRFPGLW
jgi:hypothetical protein